MKPRLQALQALAKARSTERKVASWSTLVILPVTIGFLGAFTPDVHEHFGLAFTVVIWAILLFLLAMFFWRWDPGDQSVLSLILSNEKLEQDVSELEALIEVRNRSIQLLSTQSGYSVSARSIALNHARGSISTEAELINAIQDLTAPVVEQGEEIFGLGASERWSFAVYLYSERLDILLPVWRDKARTHPSTGLGRRWGRGEGHVGKAFVDQTPYITGNSQGEEARHFSIAPANKVTAYDVETYVSFAAIPIGPIIEGDSRPYGVLVGTSDRPGRFNRENSGVLVQIASAIAALLITGALDIDKLIERTSEAGK